MVIVVDDADRENEGDLVMGASFAKAEQINLWRVTGAGLYACLWKRTGSIN